MKAAEEYHKGRRKPTAGMVGHPASAEKNGNYLNFLSGWSE
jgi:hypothetical protein